jgi:N-acetyltransferase
MRQYSRNVRRAWDGDDYRPPKRMRLQEDSYNVDAQQPLSNKENVGDAEDGLERAIRETSVAALSSSPSRKNSTVFSGESNEFDRATTITPPSSPPPVPALQLTPPKAAPRKPTFSILDKSKKDKPKQTPKRKHDASNEVRCDGSVPLTEIHNSSQFSTRPASATPAPSSFQAVNGNDVTTRPAHLPLFPGLMKDTNGASKNLTQTRLDFGQSLAPVTCPECAMTYTPADESDTVLHNMYHNRHKSGIDLGKPFLKSAMKWCYEVPSIPGSVVVVDRKISLPSRKVVQKVLEVVNKELGSVDISEEDLWSQRPVPGDADDSRKCDRFKAFLHVIDGKCVAIALAERISKCYRVLPTGSQVVGDKMDLDTNTGGAPASSETLQVNGVEHHALKLSKEVYPAVVGVSRIWTSKTSRRQGIANNLLDCVVNQFIYGMEIDKEKVGFSQPTDAGADLAKAWFDEPAGWGVYTEE